MTRKEQKRAENFGGEGGPAVLGAKIRRWWPPCEPWKAAGDETSLLGMPKRAEQTRGGVGMRMGEGSKGERKRTKFESVRAPKPKRI